MCRTNEIIDNDQIDTLHDDNGGLEEIELYVDLTRQFVTPEEDIGDEDEDDDEDEDEDDDDEEERDEDDKHIDEDEFNEDKDVEDNDDEDDYAQSSFNNSFKYLNK